MSYIRNGQAIIILPVWKIVRISKQENKILWHLSLLPLLICNTLEGQLYLYFFCFLRFHVLAFASIIFLWIKSSDSPSLDQVLISWTVARLNLVTRLLLFQGGSKNTAVREKGFKTNLCPHVFKFPFFKGRLTCCLQLSSRQYLLKHIPVFLGAFSWNRDTNFLCIQNCFVFSVYRGQFVGSLVGWDCPSEGKEPHITQVFTKWCLKFSLILHLACCSNTILSNKNYEGGI